LVKPAARRGLPFASMTNEPAGEGHKTRIPCDLPRAARPAVCWRRHDGRNYRLVTVAIVPGRANSCRAASAGRLPPRAVVLPGGARQRNRADSSVGQRPGRAGTRGRGRPPRLLGRGAGRSSTEIGAGPLSTPEHVRTRPQARLARGRVTTCGRRRDLTHRSTATANSPPFLHLSDFTW